jgi:hypothetical protein
VGCGCGGSTWTPSPAPGSQADADAVTTGPRGIDNPATFWTGPSEPAPQGEAEAQPVEA